MWCRPIRLIVIFTLAILAAPLAAAAQQAGKVYRIGCILGGPLANCASQWDVFRQALHELGWVEGQNMRLELRSLPSSSASTSMSSLPAAAAQRGPPSTPRARYPL